MAAPEAKKLLLLDTIFLFDLAAGESFAKDFKDLLRRLGFQLLVPRTLWFGSEIVEQGLGFLVGHPADQRVVRDGLPIDERFTLVVR